MNKDCECELELLDNVPICKDFEPVDDEDCPDCCKQCRHSELCHPRKVSELKP